MDMYRNTAPLLLPPNHLRPNVLAGDGGDHSSSLHERRELLMIDKFALLEMIRNPINDKLSEADDYFRSIEHRSSVTVSLWPSTIDRIKAQTQMRPQVAIELRGTQQAVDTARTLITQLLHAKMLYRLTLYMFVTIAEHSHIINGKGGNCVRTISEETNKCHIHFPDCNCNAKPQHKSNLVVLAPTNVIPKGFMDGKRAVELMMVGVLELDSNLYRIGRSKSLFFCAGITIAKLNEKRRLRRLSEPVTCCLQAARRGVQLPRRYYYQKRVQQMHAVHVIQRENCAAQPKRCAGLERAANQKFQLQNIALENRVSELLAQRFGGEEGEEERGKELQKNKTRLEAQLQELPEERIEREQTVGTEEVERARRQAEKDCVEQLREQLSERKLKVEELQLQLAERDQDLIDALARCDVEAAEKVTAHTVLRQTLNKMGELQEDLDAEKVARKELKALKTVLLPVSHHDTTTTTAHQAMQIKREEEKMQQEARSLDCVVQLADVCRLHARDLGELKQLDELREIRTALERQKQQLEGEAVDMANELKASQAARIDLDKRRAHAEQQLQKLQQELEQMRKVEQNSILLLKTETTQKLQLLTKVRQTEAERDDLREQLDAVRETLDRQLAQAVAQVGVFKKRSDDADQSSAAVQEARKRVVKELEEVRARESSLLAEVDKLDKQRQKLQTENEDLLREIEQAQSQVASYEKRQQIFDQVVNDEKARSDQLLLERDTAQQEARERETRVLAVQRRVEELTEQLDESDRARRNLQSELDDLVSTKDDVGKNVQELEKAKRMLEQQVLELQQDILNFEDKLTAAEVTRERTELELNSQKAKMENELAAKDEQAEERRRALVRQVRHLENELEEERKNKTSVTASRKKIEAELLDLQQSLEMANRHCDENSKTVNRLQQTVKDSARDIEQLVADRESFKLQQQETERRARQLETDLLRAQEACDQAERARRNAERERDGLQEQFGNSLSQRTSSFADEKRKLESRVVELELAESQATLQLSERKRLDADLSRVGSELTSERARLVELETQYERKVRDQRRQIDDLVSTKGDVGKKVRELEKAKRMLEQQVLELQQNIVNFEGELTVAEAARKRTELELKSQNVEMIKRDKQRVWLRSGKCQLESRVAELEEELKQAESRATSQPSERLDAEEAEHAPLQRNARARKGRSALTHIDGKWSVEADSVPK